MGVVHSGPMLSYNPQVPITYCDWAAPCMHQTSKPVYTRLISQLEPGSDYTQRMLKSTVRWSLTRQYSVQ